MTMARSPYTKHDRLIVVDVEPQHMVVKGAEGGSPVPRQVYPCQRQPAAGAWRHGGRHQCEPVERPHGGRAGDARAARGTRLQALRVPARAGAAMRKVRRDDGYFPISPRVYCPATRGRDIWDLRPCGR